MNVAVGARSDTGRVRRGNEDALLVEEPLFAVADGMGGHIAGDIASATAVDVIAQGARDARPQDPEALGTLVRNANSAIWQKAQGDPNLRGMGTTCTLLMIADDRAHLAHVGDSRAYLLRDQELVQVTEDHTLVGRMVREGRLSPEEADHHPQRSIITRALGVDSDIQVDLISRDVAEGDRIVLSSDGLTSMIAVDRIAEVLRDEADPQRAADRLVELANEAGGDDNITVVVVDVGKGASIASPPLGAPARTDTDPGQHLDEPPSDMTAARARPRTRRRMVTALVVVLAAVAGAVLAGRYAISNSWFVGVNGDGDVTIYRGIPEEIAGASFKTAEEVTDIDADELPESYRGDVEDGRKVASRQDAEQYVANLASRIEEIEQATEQRRTPDNADKDRS